MWWALGANSKIHGKVTDKSCVKEVHQDLFAKQVPVSAYGGNLKNLKDQRDYCSRREPISQANNYNSFVENLSWLVDSTVFRFCERGGLRLGRVNSGDTTPCVKSHRSSYTELYPQTLRSSYTGLYPQMSGAGCQSVLTSEHASIWPDLSYFRPLFYA